MVEAPKNSFINPEVAAVISPKIDTMPAESSMSNLPIHKAKMRRAMGLRHAINETAGQLGTDPFIVAKEVRLAQTQNALKAREIEEQRVRRYGYVGDIHGLSDADFAKLRTTLAQENFDQVFFIGDIGGSEKLARLQRIFYQGGGGATDNQLWNRYQQLSKEGANDQTFLTELKPGYLNLATYERVLAKHGKLPEEKARQQAEELTDEQILAGIKKLAKYKHYGHYVSDLSDDIITTLATDVEGYYERFSHMVAELRLHTKAKVYTIQGNWDARLPFDFEAGTEMPVPLPEKKRRFNVGKFFADNGIVYFKTIGTVETNESVHILVPFDTVTKPAAHDTIAKLQKAISKARKDGKTIIMVAHAVPSWERHKKPSTGEGQLTETNLQKLVTDLDPDELVYGHEHFIRKDENGNPILDVKYRVIKEKGKITIGENEKLQELGKKTSGTIASHIPIPGEPFNGIASVEIALQRKNKAPRGRGGLRSPVRVGKNNIIQRRMSDKLPGAEILHPQVKTKV